jgi:hypothetical protein
MSNLPSEQIRTDLSLDIELDKRLTSKQKDEIIENVLCKENIRIMKHNSSKYYIYNNSKKNIVLLVSQITYLGAPHPEFKKRMQLKNWYLDVIEKYKHMDNYEVKFLGIYKYKENIIFVDFDKTNYIKRNLNNSSAHVYTNDLFQAMKLGQFRKEDSKNNIITSVKLTEFKKYLDNDFNNSNNILELFKKFNNGLPFGKWLNAFEIMIYLHKENSNDWAQSEWAGFFIEHEFEKFTKNNNVENIMKYIKNKRTGTFDFDIWFEEDNYYGDLKASDINKLEAPGNDKDTFVECINKYDKFWYIIYEHETKKDSDEDGYATTKQINNYKYINGKWPNSKEYDELSYFSRMKKEINFKMMHIIELNRINYRDILNDFNQGRQPSGESRKVKFKIIKKHIDNFSIFNYKYDEYKYIEVETEQPIELFVAEKT